MTTSRDMRTPLKRIRGYGTIRSGTDHFWQQRLTALANLPLVLFFIGLVIALHGATHAEVVATIGSPLVAILLILAIASVTYHMRLGMQVVIEDYIHRESTKIVLVILNTFFAILVAFSSIFAILRISFFGV